MNYTQTGDESWGQEEWERTCSTALARDLLWKLHAYRAALFLLHLVNGDPEMLRRNGRASIADQLQRAAASVSANIAEGYSRSGRADRIKFFDYALGSARECISWFEASRGILSDAALESRQQQLSKVRGLTLGLIRNLRAQPNSPRFSR